MQEVRIRASAAFKQLELMQIAQVAVITTALTIITRLAHQQAQKHIKRKVLPYQDKINPRWAMNILTASYLASAVALSGPYLRSPPPNRRNDNNDNPQRQIVPVTNRRPKTTRQRVIENAFRSLRHELHLARPYTQPLPPPRESRIASHPQPSFQLALVGHVQEQALREFVENSFATLQEAMRNRNIHFIRNELNLGGRSFVIEVNLQNAFAVQRCVQAHQHFLSALPQRQTLQFETPKTPMIQWEWQPRIERNPFLSAHPLAEYRDVPQSLLEELLQPPERNLEDSFIFVSPLALPEVGISNENLFGTNGELMRWMLFRNLLNEYIFLLQSEGVNLKDALESQELARALYFLTDPESATNAKEQYEGFIDALEALILAEKTPEVAKVCQAMARARMTPRIQSFQAEFVAQHLPDQEAMNLGNFADVFVKRNRAIAASNPNMRVDWWTCQQIKLYGAVSWDHYMKFDPPQLRNMEDDVLYVRHSTPNKWDPINKKPIIDPCYREFIRSVDGMVLYAAHQRLFDDGTVENEDIRCQTLVELEKEEKNLLLLFQSVENKLFKNGAATFQELKDKLVASFYETSGYRRNRLPLRLQEDAEYREEMVSICNFIHEHFFNNAVDIDPTRIDLYGGLPEDKQTTQWQLFIMLFYYYQREGIKKRFDVKVVNTGCKNNFDRGGGQNIISDIMHLFEIYGKNIPSEKLKDIADSIQAPTLQLKGIEPIKYRVHPALVLSKLLARLPLEKMAAIRKRGRVKKLTVLKRDNQPAIFRPKDAQTIGEYQAILTSLRGTTYTRTTNGMVQDNLRYHTKETIIRQLERNYQNGLSVDGYIYNGSTGWWNQYPYTIEQIYKLLTEDHKLSEERAVLLMNQLEVQIFSDPFQNLQSAFQTERFMLRGIPGNSSPISLNTVGDAFVIEGNTQFEIVDMNNDGTRVTTLSAKVEIQIPKDEEARATANWSWHIN